MSGADDVARLVQVTRTTLAHPGPLTTSDPVGDGTVHCIACGAPIGTGACCLDPIREALAPLTRGDQLR